MPLTHTTDGVELILAHEDELPLVWIGDRAVEERMLAAWLVLRADDLPLNPRIIGKPGVGKTTLAYSIARRLERPVYIMQCTMDTRPEDLIVTPVLTAAGRVAYHASGLTTAMIRGGVCILDEGNRMSEKSWASLAPLLDARRYVESLVAGIKIKAHADFRVCVTMNEDSSTFDVPEYIQTRLKPMIEVGFPRRHEELAILRLAVPFATEALLKYVTDFLQKAHSRNLPFTSRDGIHIVRYALKMGSVKGQPPEGFLVDSIDAVLGEEGLAFVDSGDVGNRLRGALRVEAAADDDDEPPDDEDLGLTDDEPEEDGGSGRDK